MLITGLALGAVLGFVMQRGRFCVTGFLRDICTLKTWRGFTALLVVIAVHAVGLAALTSTGVISPEVNDFAPLAVIVGGLLFGLGIVLAGGCASGTWYRSGEGLVGSWIALAMYALSAAAMNYGPLSGMNDWLGGVTVSATTVPEALGISPWFFVVGIVALTVVMVRHFVLRDRAIPTPATLAPKKTGLAHLLTEKPWHFYVTGAIVGVLGILVGSYIAAKASGEFRVRVPDGRQAVRSIGGGVLMGVGAVWAGGCTVGNGMVQTSLFSYQGWIALLAIALGVGLAAKIWLKPDQPYNPQDAPDAPATPDADVDAATDTAAAPQAPATTATNAASGVLTMTTPVLNTATLGASGASGADNGGLTSPGDGRWMMDTLGAVCPFPLIEAKDAIKRIDIGDELVIEFDCTQATDALPRWAATDGHEVTQFEATGDAGWIISVKRGT
ncbi:MAG: YeeE/YedE family protein [Corynebacterium sp.]|uniref:YeeE/YedE thiosulfate transporter family protein n=1 Tax=Corynebacterium sp. TaxID=1720 RepID=UPI00264A4294|nr:YeeE/YedE thiosulfate transporter family protein [Corynebacterium sp.]MDN5721395.1 YeeE/YedE family protein [Corynebacterium sp.]MDN6281686.1 YeeE/YedE family protein [Corynebacterium sp.]MDN6304540.1 YeeE/YedE family protein [Corynebacterium sp.]MDN6366265.1 YeeE/YedE family protein [Corynebacterium sp.]MDN6374607.1 YeeE/YedE family protein [Corynebacterium sp.]